MLGNIFIVFLIIIVPVMLFAISCVLAGTASKRKCTGCGLRESCGGSCDGDKEDKR